MKKFLSLLVAALLLAGAVAALAEDQLVVHDTAGVLDSAITQRVIELNEETKSSLGIQLRVITKHFLGGSQAAAYANEARMAYEDADDIILLVMVIGEERYAISIGPEAALLISQESASNILASAFRQPFLNRDYQGALDAFLSQLAGQMQISSGKAFDRVDPASSVIKLPTITKDPLDGFFRERELDIDKARRYEEDIRDAKDGRNRLSMWQIILIGFILYKIFGRNRHTGKKRGCGPLGWIFGTWGLSKFFGFRK